MENDPIFYTVLVDTEGFPIHYCAPPEYQIQTYNSQASDPGESCGEFEAKHGKSRCCYLSQEAFQKKASALAQ